MERGRTRPRDGRGCEEDAREAPSRRAPFTLNLNALSRARAGHMSRRRDAHSRGEGGTHGQSILDRSLPPSPPSTPPPATQEATSPPEGGRGSGSGSGSGGPSSGSAHPSGRSSVYDSSRHSVVDLKDASAMLSVHPFDELIARSQGAENRRRLVRNRWQLARMLLSNPALRPYRAHALASAEARRQMLLDAMGKGPRRRKIWRRLFSCDSCDGDEDGSCCVGCCGGCSCCGRGQGKDVHRAVPPHGRGWRAAKDARRRLPAKPVARDDPKARRQLLMRQRQASLGESDEGEGGGAESSEDESLGLPPHLARPGSSCSVPSVRASEAGSVDTRTSTCDHLPSMRNTMGRSVDTLASTIELVDSLRTSCVDKERQHA